MDYKISVAEPADTTIGQDGQINVINAEGGAVTAQGGFQAGKNSSATTGGAVGAGAAAAAGFSGGYNAVATVDAVQLGAGTNTVEKSLQIYGDNIYNAATHTLSVQSATIGGKPAATQEYVDAIVANIDLSGYVSDGQLGDVLSGYATTEYVNKAIFGDVDLSAFVTNDQFKIVLREYVTVQQVDSMIGDIDFSGFVTHDGLDEVLQSYATVQYVDNLFGSIDLSVFATTEYVDGQLATKQNALVSGENIKTINGQSLLEGGDMIIKSTVVKTASQWASENSVLSVGTLGYDSTNGTTKIGDGVTAWDALPAFASTRFTFATATWQDISRIAAEGNAKKYFHVGDEKVIELSTGEVITLVILGFDHDDLSDGQGKAPITIGMKNLLATEYEMYSKAYNNVSWRDSDLRDTLNTVIKGQLPSDLQSVLRTVVKKTSAGDRLPDILTTEDEMFLCSRVEIDGTGDAVYSDEGKQYEYWKTVKDGTKNEDRVKYPGNSNTAIYWWTRSPNIMDAATFRYFKANGVLQGLLPFTEAGVSFCFCV